MPSGSHYREPGSPHANLGASAAPAHEHSPPPEGSCRRPTGSRAPEAAAEAPGRRGLRVHSSVSWGVGYSRDQRPQLGKTPPKAECLGSRGEGPVLPKGCREPRGERSMLMARLQQRPRTPRPHSSRRCLPPGPCSICAAVGHPAAAPGPCSPASPPAPDPPPSPSHGSSRQWDPPPRPGGSAAGWARCSAPAPEKMSQPVPAPPLALAAAVPCRACPAVSAPACACDRAAGPRTEPGFEEKPQGWLLSRHGHVSGTAGPGGGSTAVPGGQRAPPQPPNPSLAGGRGSAPTVAWASATCGTLLTIAKHSRIGLNNCSAAGLLRRGQTLSQR